MMIKMILPSSGEPASESKRRRRRYHHTTRQLRHVGRQSQLRRRRHNAMALATARRRGGVDTDGRCEGPDVVTEQPTGRRIQVQFDGQRRGKPSRHRLCEPDRQKR